MGTKSGFCPTTENLPPKARGSIDGFVNTQAIQATLNSKRKKEEKNEVCQQIGRFFFSTGIPFNIANDPYYCLKELQIIAPILCLLQCMS